MILLLLPVFAEGQIITTVAGNGSTGHSGDGGPATSAGIAYNGYGVFDKYGNYYFAEETNGDRICKIDTAGIITTIAGMGGHYYSGDSGLATAANLFAPVSIAFDSIGNIYIDEVNDGRIRKIDIATGIITTYAGNGTMGYGGDGGPATSAMLYAPQDICLDKKGNLYIADYYNNRVRKVNTSGIITTFAGNGISGSSGDGGLADTARVEAMGIGIDDTGNIYIADASFGRLRKVDTFGFISTIAGTGVVGNNGDGGPALSAQIEATFVRVDKSGNIYLTTAYLVETIRKIDVSGIITTIAGNGTAGFSGDGGPATAAELNNPNSLTIDNCGNIYIADDYNHRIRKVTFDTSCGPKNSLDVISIPPTQNLTIFPNPATTSLTISGNEAIEDVVIVNVMGQVAVRETVRRNSASVNIDVSRLPGGVYFVRVNGQVRKFVKK